MLFSLLDTNETENILKISQNMTEEKAKNYVLLSFFMNKSSQEGGGNETILPEIVIGEDEQIIEKNQATMTSYSFSLLRLANKQRRKALLQIFKNYLLYTQKEFDQMEDEDKEDYIPVNKEKSLYILITFYLPYLVLMGFDLENKDDEKAAFSFQSRNGDIEYLKVSAFDLLELSSTLLSYSLKEESDLILDFSRDFYAFYIQLFEHFYLSSDEEDEDFEYNYNEEIGQIKAKAENMDDGFSSQGLEDEDFDEDFDEEADDDPKDVLFFRSLAFVSEDEKKELLEMFKQNTKNS